MKKLYVTEEEWEAAARNYYTHLAGDRVVVVDWMGYQGYDGTVVLPYTTDQFNHEAFPHKRYLVSLDCGRLEDACLSEVKTASEWREILYRMERGE